jgi:hypothetical protein
VGGSRSDRCACCNGRGRYWFAQLNLKPTRLGPRPRPRPHPTPPHAHGGSHRSCLGASPSHTAAIPTPSCATLQSVSGRGCRTHCASSHGSSKGRAAPRAARAGGSRAQGHSGERRQSRLLANAAMGAAAAELAQARAAVGRRWRCARRWRTATTGARGGAAGQTCTVRPTGCCAVHLLGGLGWCWRSCPQRREAVAGWQNAVVGCPSE